MDANTSSPPAQPSRLSDQINTATRYAAGSVNGKQNKAYPVHRSQHHVVNKFISSRLPLCLPPLATQPDLYLFGLSQIAELFFTFEDAWNEVTNPSQMQSLDNSFSGWASPETYPQPYPDSVSREEQLLDALRTLRPMGMARSSRLKNDLEYLRCVCGVAEQDTRSLVLETVKAHVEANVRTKPHLLLAYAWTLYMAVFSGGRHIRNALCAPGLGFWLGHGKTTAQAAPSDAKKAAWNWRSPVARLMSTPQAPQETPMSRKPKSAEELSLFEGKGLSFWYFPGGQDGEELRAEFKERLLNMEALLTVSQRDEIVAEAQMIFSRVEALVTELDAAVANGMANRMPRHVAGPAGNADDALDSDSASLGSTVRGSAAPLQEVPAPRREVQQRGLDTPSLAALSLVVGCISWYAAYHAGLFS